MSLVLSQLSCGFLYLQPDSQVSPDPAFSDSAVVPCGLCTKILSFGNCQLFFCVPEGFFVCCVSHAIRRVCHFHFRTGALPACFFSMFFHPRLSGLPCSATLMGILGKTGRPELIRMTLSLHAGAYPHPAGSAPASPGSDQSPLLLTGSPHWTRTAAAPG